MRYGFRGPLAAGLITAALALLWLARAPVHGSFLVDVLPAMILFGIGGGLAFNPVLMAAMSDVEPQDSGLASGLTNTAFMMGGALGLAALASAASARTHHLAATSHGPLTALTGGYHLAFVLGAVLAVAACVVGAAFLRDRQVAVPGPHAEPAPEPA
jgi:MFS family permease